MKERETIAAYKAFRCYWELGDERTLIEVTKRCQISSKSVYQWRTKYRWDERIDEDAAAVRQLWLKAVEKKFEQTADALAEARLSYTLKSIEASIALQEKGLEILKRMQVLETKQKVVSPDGKTTHVTLQPAQNIRVGDAVTLILAANDNLAAAETGLARARERIFRAKERPTGSSQPNGSTNIVMELWVDGGDGTPMPLSTIPEPDDSDPNLNPYDGTSAPPPDNPLGSGQIAES